MKMAKSIRRRALSICFIISISGAWSGAKSTLTGTPPRRSSAGSGSCRSRTEPKVPDHSSENSAAYVLAMRSPLSTRT